MAGWRLWLVHHGKPGDWAGCTFAALIMGNRCRVKGGAVKLCVDVCFQSFVGNFVRRWMFLAVMRVCVPFCEKWGYCRCTHELAQVLARD